MAFEAFGVGVQVTLGDEDLSTRLLEVLPPGRSPCDPEQATGHFDLRTSDADAYELKMGGAPLVENATLDVALGMLEAQIRMFIAVNARDWIFVHAGAVARDGEGSRISGRELLRQDHAGRGAGPGGRDLLLRRIRRAGCRWPSTPVCAAAIDSWRRRRADARATRWRAWWRRGGGERRGERRGRHALSDRDGAWQPRRLSSGEGMVALLANTVPAQERPEESLRVLSRAVTGAIVLESDRGEAGPVAAALLDELAAAAAR